jgi:hypothetical protein
MKKINKRDTKFKTDYDMFAYDDYVDSKNKLAELFSSKTIDDRIKIDNLFLFTDPKMISRALFFNFIYEKILEVPGYIFEFGTRYGNFASLFTSLRDIYEPFNRTRKIIACDTFTGLFDLSKTNDPNFKENDFATPKHYETYLESIFKCKEKFSALPHHKRYEILKGDASKTIKTFLGKNKETLIALAFFDMDIYKPTKNVLNAIKPFLTKGSILVFDDAICELSPGETIAIKETFGFDKISLKRWQYNSRLVYFVVE